MRVASVDIGTNSTRLLVADVDPVGAWVERELSRHSRVTRLGAGVDASGRLSEEAQGRVFQTLSEYRAEIDRYDCEGNIAVLTSAVRDAANGREFADRVRDDFGLDARVLEGEQEAQLTFMGAMSGRERSPQATVVIDVGGGSTEFVVGQDHTVGFHTSLNAGVVRMSERHIHSDPPTDEELRELAEDVRGSSPAVSRPTFAGRSPPASPSPAPPPRRRRSTSSSTPTTPSGSTAIRSRWKPSSSSCGGFRRWTKRSGGRWWA